MIIVVAPADADPAWGASEGGERGVAREDPDHRRRRDWRMIRSGPYVLAVCTCAAAISSLTWAQ
jgi:hypothetical protein